MNFILEGLDRLGKDTLIKNLMNRLGFFQVLHKSKPESLDIYKNMARHLNVSDKFLYQKQCFAQDMSLLKYAEISACKLIFNRSWIGEAVYAPLYRSYSGQYVFDLEKNAGLDTLSRTRLILLTEDFSCSKHFQDDGLSLGGTDKRQQEQDLFIDAFYKSIIKDKKIICVTDRNGQFKSEEQILKEALA